MCRRQVYSHRLCQNCDQMHGPGSSYLPPRKVCAPRDQAPRPASHVEGRQRQGPIKNGLYHNEVRLSSAVHSYSLTSRSSRSWHSHITPDVTRFQRAPYQESTPHLARETNSASY